MIINPVNFDPTIHKRCKGCLNTFLKTEFYKHKSTADRLSTRCKACTRQKALKIEGDNTWFNVITNGSRSKYGFIVLVYNPMYKYMVKVHKTDDVTRFMENINSVDPDAGWTLVKFYESKSVDNLYLTLLHYVGHRVDKKPTWYKSYEPTHTALLNDFNYIEACYKAVIAGANFPAQEDFAVNVPEWQGDIPEHAINNPFYQ